MISGEQFHSDNQGWARACLTVRCQGRRRRRRAVSAAALLQAASLQGICNLPSLLCTLRSLETGRPRAYRRLKQWAARSLVLRRPRLRHKRYQRLRERLGVPQRPGAADRPDALLPCLGFLAGCAGGPCCSRRNRGETASAGTRHGAREAAVGKPGGAPTVAPQPPPFPLERAGGTSWL